MEPAEATDDVPFRPREPRKLRNPMLFGLIVVLVAAGTVYTIFQILNAVEMASPIAVREEKRDSLAFPTILACTLHYLRFVTCEITHNDTTESCPDGIFRIITSEEVACFLINFKEESPLLSYSTRDMFYLIFEVDRHFARPMVFLSLLPPGTPWEKGDERNGGFMAPAGGTTWVTVSTKEIHFLDGKKYVDFSPTVSSLYESSSSYVKIFIVFQNMVAEVQEEINPLPWTVVLGICLGTISFLWKAYDGLRGTVMKRCNKCVVTVHAAV